MSESDVVIRILDGEIDKALSVLERIGSKLAAFEQENLAREETTQEQAMVVAHYLSNYFTCCETVFLRVSRHFENNLPGERWHQALLEKMALDIPGIRPALIDDALRADLLELLKFRHFTRYYFELDYDWEKLRFLLGKFHGIRSKLPASLQKFQAYLREIR
jgi:hypothetical protein